jgi:hypothetical protein
MQSLPLSVIVNDGEEHIVSDDETVFSVTVKDFILVLENSSEFYKNPTEEIMIKVLKEFIRDAIGTLVLDADWYIRKAMPIFLEKEFTQK